MRAFIQQICLFGIITVLLFELIGFIDLNFLYKGQPPSYLPTESFKPNFHADINEVFGVWHPNNIHRTFIGPCYQADYYSNSYGARDFERKRESTKERVFVLGDSYLEGFGVDSVYRLTNVLERETGKSFLNFTTAGNFGPVQYYLLYKEFQSKFDHNEVLIGLTLPGEFKDDDLEQWKGKKRYRPYWDGDYPNYELVYLEDALDKSTYIEIPDEEAQLDKFKNSISWSYSMLANRRIPESTKDYWGKRPYQPTEQEKIDKLLFSLQKIILLAGSRKVSLMTIPSYQTLNWNQNRIKPNYINALEDFVRSNPNRVSFIYTEDFMDKKNLRKYFFECNGHWGVDGNQIIADILLDNNFF